MDLQQGETTMLRSSVRMLDDWSREGSQSRNFSDFMRETWLIWVVILMIILIVIFAIFTIREFLWECYRINCCRKRATRQVHAEMDVVATRNARTIEAERQAADPSAAVTSPTSSYESVEGDRRENRMMERRLERRSWYEYSLAKFSHIVKEEEIIQERANNEISKSIIIQCEGAPRRIDGTCSICLDYYEPNEKIVWSPFEDCKHVYHWECKLSWLEKGKKRCPICRNWFVSGLKISDQISAEFGDDFGSPSSTLAEPSETENDSDREEGERDYSV